MQNQILNKLSLFLTIISTFSCLCLFSHTSIAGDKIFNDLYVKAEAGVSFSENAGDFSFIDQNGFLGAFNKENIGESGIYGLGIGIKLTQNINLEILANYKGDNEFDSLMQIPTVQANLDTITGDISSWSFFSNLSYMFRNHSYKWKKAALTP